MFALRQSLIARFVVARHRQMAPGVANGQRPPTNDRLHPMPSSSEDSNGVPQRRQMTAEQSPQVSGSLTSTAQTGQ
jgi:hypothetical protein